VKRKKLRTLSVTSKLAGPPEPIFFLDRAIESKVVIARLREVGAIVEPHSAHFSPDEEDPVWLSEVGARGWVVFTRDERIRYREAERKALVEAQIKAFVLVAKSLRGAEMAEILVEALPGIRRVIQDNSPPFIAKIYRDASVSLWYPQE
jgi:PIN like domain